MHPDQFTIKGEVRESVYVKGCGKVTAKCTQVVAFSLRALRSTQVWLAFVCDAARGGRTYCDTHRKPISRGD